MTEFDKKIYDVLCEIPKGHVVTYGQLAELAGYPGAARAVGNTLHRNPDPINVPCFRVVNSKGKLAKNFGFGGAQRQKEFLENDGIEVIDYTVDLKKYIWKTGK